MDSKLLSRKTHIHRQTYIDFRGRDYKNSQEKLKNKKHQEHYVRDVQRLHKPPGTTDFTKETEIRDPISPHRISIRND